MSNLTATLNAPCARCNMPVTFEVNTETSFEFERKVLQYRIYIPALESYIVLCADCQQAYRDLQKEWFQR